MPVPCPGQQRPSRTRQQQSRWSAPAPRPGRDARPQHLRLTADPGTDPRTHDLGVFLNTVEKVVVSRTLQEAGWENSRIARDLDTVRDRIEDFADWANREAARHSPRGQAIPADPHGSISLARFRRSLAWHIARRPNGLVALARKLLKNEDAMVYDNPHALVLCHYKRDRALCHRAVNDTPSLDRCVPGCGNIARTDQQAATCALLAAASSRSPAGCPPAPGTSQEATSCRTCRWTCRMPSSLPSCCSSSLAG